MEITRDKIDSLVSMLNSNTEEDQNLGFEILNNVDSKNNVIPMLLIYKLVNKVSVYTWRNKCPEFFENLISPLNEQGIITYKDISSVINSNTSITEIEMFKEAVEGFISNTVKKAGIDFIDSLYIDFNDTVYKNKLAYDKDRVTSKS